LPAAPPVVTHLSGDPFLEVEVAVRHAMLAGSENNVRPEMIAPPLRLKDCRKDPPLHGSCRLRDESGKNPHGSRLQVSSRRPDDFGPVLPYPAPATGYFIDFSVKFGIDYIGVIEIHTGKTVGMTGLVSIRREG